MSDITELSGRSKESILGQTQCQDQHGGPFGSGGSQPKPARRDATLGAASEMIPEAAAAEAPGGLTVPAAGHSLQSTVDY